MIRGYIRKRAWKTYLKEWKKHFSGCEIIPKSYIPFEKIELGAYSYGPLDLSYWGGSDEHLIIGKFVSIADNVKFILGGNHDYTKLSTFPFKYFFDKAASETLSKGEIIVGDDVWLGINSMILSGVKIGQGSIVAAGSVVTKDIQPYSIVGGNPARVIKKRFSEDVVQYLLKIDFSKITPDNYQKYKSLFYTKMDVEIAKKLLIAING